MGLFEMIMIAVGLAMDAFAVAVCKGLAMKKLTIGGICTVGLWFGVFQGLMPLLGDLLGATFANSIAAFDHWITFLLMLAIGLNMLKEAFSKKGAEESSDASLAIHAMFPLALATSIDALAAGVTFAFLIRDPHQLLFAVSLIAAITFLLSAFGVFLGHLFGERYQKKAEAVGGIVLILIGLKILLEHLFF